MVNPFFWSLVLIDDQRLAFQVVLGVIARGLVGVKEKAIP
jgi:hypothetical protein